MSCARSCTTSPTRAGGALALRADGTASAVRAYVQNRPVLPWKAWYVAPNFRYERPQKGRYRQHWQVGVEVLGVDDPDIDVEVIALADGFYRELGLRRYRLSVNSMGDAESRAAYREVLLEYWRRHADVLGDEMARAEANPLRILDSKRADWQDMIERAPQIGEYLSPESAQQFERVQEGLQVLGIDFEIAPRLVRGLDYYSGTTFEFASDALDAAQNAIGGGGRYDRLAEDMGGPPTPGIGFGIGIERVLHRRRRRRCVPGTARAPRRLRRRCGRRHRGAAADPGAPRRRVARGSGVREPQVRKAARRRRQVRGALQRHSRSPKRPRPDTSR